MDKTNADELGLQVTRTCAKYASMRSLRAAVKATGAVPEVLDAAVKLVKGYPDTSNYHPFGRSVSRPEPSAEDA